jgi:hypothetical protein
MQAWRIDMTSAFSSCVNGTPEPGSASGHIVEVPAETAHLRVGKHWQEEWQYENHQSTAALRRACEGLQPG